MTGAGCGGGGLPELASSKQFWAPCFNGVLFFPGTVLTYKISLHMREREGMGGDMFC